jgi:hypothetical protein
MADMKCKGCGRVFTGPNAAALLAGHRKELVTVEVVRFGRKTSTRMTRGSAEGLAKREADNMLRAHYQDEANKRLGRAVLKFGRLLLRPFRKAN